MPPKKILKKNLKKKDEESIEETSSAESDVLSTSTQEDDTNSTENIIMTSESESKDCEIDKMIQDDMDFFNQDDSIDVHPEHLTKYVKGDQRITNPRLTRYEMVRIIGERTKQLTMGAKPLVKNFQDLSYEDIAVEELKLNMTPFKIKRPMPNNKIEIWEIKELDKKHLQSFIED
jgi:DNA-directed RNA polymerase subunit K/omega